MLLTQTNSLGKQKYEWGLQIVWEYQYYWYYFLPLGFELYRVVLRADTVGDSNNVLGLKVLLCDCENPETDVNLTEIQ